MPPNDDYPDAPNGRRTLKEGQKYQEFVRGLLNPWGIVHHHFESKAQQYAFGENRQGHEIKLDLRCTETGRLSIEIQEKTARHNLEWVDSGILRKDNSWLYVQGNYDIVFVFSKKWLLRWYREKVVPEDVHESHGTIRKFYLPIKAARLMACLVIDGNGKRIDDE